MMIAKKKHTTSLGRRSSVGDEAQIRTRRDPAQESEQSYKIPKLPLGIDLETKPVLKKQQEATRALAELKGFAQSIPNQNILIRTLVIQEAKDSSAIENIVTTHDELFRSDVEAGRFASPAAKEVHNYVVALLSGYEEVRKKGLLTNNLIQTIQARIEGNNAGFRKQAGTALISDRTQQIVYTPPQNYTQIQSYMKNLEAFINEDSLSDWDPLLKMAVIHHNFESIHPFYDGNGRTGRIMNILFLVYKNLLDTPILYLSRYINQNKTEYYRLLRLVQEEGAWEDWVLYILEGVRLTSYQTISLIDQMKTLMRDHKIRIRDALPRIYSQDLVNNLFSHPYTKTQFLARDLRVHRNTARKYLEELVALEILARHTIGRETFYLNKKLFQLFLDSSKTELPG